MPVTNGGAPQRLIIAITGATGAIYGVRLLQALQGAADVETHLLMSPAGVMNLQHELDMGRAEVEALADVVHNVRDIGATIASGSFRANAMIVAPCSMRTCGNRPRPFRQPHHARGGRHAQGAAQAGADGAETPLNLAHLRNMTAVTEMGGIVFPPVPGFYQKPQTIDELVDHTVGRVLDLVDLREIGEKLAPGWGGLNSSTEDLKR
jgi:4-hydroxy-3-polyprenylbenzoate decarboxylase